MQEAMGRLTATGAGASSSQIAEAAIRKWQEFDAALSPILGSHGVAALYERSLHLIHDDYPWLVSDQNEVRASGDFTSLKTALTKRTSAEASAANSLLYQTFHTTLVNLIGELLVDRLLKSTLDYPLHLDPAQAR